MMQLGKICRARPCQSDPARTEDTKTPSYQDRFDRVIAHIRKSLDRDLSLDALADVAALSRFHFHRVFTAMIGETVADARLAALSDTGPCIQIGASFGRLMDEIEKDGLMRRLAGPAFGVYYDDPSTIPAAELRAHAGMQLSDRQPIPDNFDDVTIPGGRHAVLVLKGPYPGIPAAWSWLCGNCFPASGEEPANRAPFEVYRNSMADTAPGDLITEICVPLR